MQLDRGGLAQTGRGLQMRVDRSAPMRVEL